MTNHPEFAPYCLVGRFATVLLAPALLACGLSANAAPPVADPTQPAVPANTAAVRGRAQPEAPPVWPQLQSIQITENGMRSALLDGRMLHVGERLGELTVTAIDAQSVLLRGARFEQRLALVPGIVKTASSAGSTDAPAMATAPAFSQRPALAMAAKENR